MARLTLSRPPLNLLTVSLIDALGAACRRLAGDPAVRVVILEGAGRAFSAGVDVRAMRELDSAGATAFIGALGATTRAVRELPVPVIARLHGQALGGALELALACDLRLAAASCRIGMPEVTVGIPSVLEAALLPGLVGWGRAAELLLTGEAIAAGEAERWGLVNRVVADEDIEREVAAWTARLVALPPRALRLQKGLLRRWRGAGLESAIAGSTETFAQAYVTDEPRRAMDAFLTRDRGMAG